jgi:hypothetical protein
MGLKSFCSYNARLASNIRWMKQAYCRICIPRAPAKFRVKNATEGTGDHNGFYGGAGKCRLKDSDGTLHGWLQKIVGNVFGTDNER